MKRASLLLIMSLFLVSVTAVAQSPDDPSFDLRDYYGDGTTDYTTSVRSQSWGTCWIFGTYASLESNLTMFGNWLEAGITGEADLALWAADFDHPDCGEDNLCVGDFDQDGDVDMVDLVVLAANFGIWVSTEF